VLNDFFIGAEELQTTVPKPYGGPCGCKTAGKYYSKNVYGSEYFKVFLQQVKLSVLIKT
jgi:hypothetical protein